MNASIIIALLLILTAHAVVEQGRIHTTLEP